MFNLKTQDQGINILAQQDYLEVLIESFLIDRKSQGLSPDTIDFYAKKLKYFLKYCEGQALTQVSQLTTDMIRRYVLGLSETHNPGGVHACFRPLRTMLYWVEEEQIMPDGWKNPIRRVKAPRLPIEPIEPIQIEDLQLLLNTCKHNFSGIRDKAMMLGLLDSGARAHEFLDLNLEDVELASGSVMDNLHSAQKNAHRSVFFVGRPRTMEDVKLHMRRGAPTGIQGLMRTKSD